MPFIPDNSIENRPTSGFVPDASEQKKPFMLPGQEAVKNFGTQMAGGVISTVSNLASLGQKMMSPITKPFGMSERATPTIQGIKDIAKPYEETPGFATEQLAEFMIPFGKVGPITKSITLDGKLLNMGVKSISQAIEFAGKTAIQSGGNAKETTTSGILGAITPPAVKVVEKVLPIIGNLMAGALGTLIRKDPENIKIAFQNPIEVAKNISAGVIPLNVREKAVKVLKTFESTVKDTFDEGLQKLQSLTPVRWATGKYNATKQIMQNELKNAMTGMPQTFRDFKVSVQNQGTKLDFDRMNSAIVKPGERSNVKMAWQTVQNQRDFSPSGVQATAARLYALRRFGDNNESSALVNSIYDRYQQSIKNVYPELFKLRQVYATQMKIIEGVDEVIKSTKSNIANPIAVTGAVRKLSNLFQEDGESYLLAVQRLEKATGVNLIKELAASEFRHIVPPTFGGAMGQLGAIAGGFIYNPWMLVALPLFSPRFVGRLATTAGKITPAVKATTPYIAPAITSGVQQIQRNLNFSNQ